MTDGPGSVTAPDSERMLEPGRVVAGRYRIVGFLGRGGMGVVAAGQQLDLERPVAIKFLRSTLAQDTRPMQRFAREARAIAKMRSEHVVRVFDVAQEAGVPFIVMERLRGHDLAAELARGPLSLTLTLEYVLQACEAIAEAHSLGIVHRDLKPSNLFLAEGFAGRRSLKVLDFGVSKWLGPSPDLVTPLSTTEGSFIGTPAYVSPEQLTRPESVDQRTDVWALGIILYQCLSGRLPFEADSVPRLCAEILTADPPPLTLADPLSMAISQVVLSCLRKELSQRCASVFALSQALAPFAAPGSLHLLDSIRALSVGVTADERAPPAPLTVTTGSEVPETTLNFSQEADSIEGIKPKQSIGQKPRIRVSSWLALVAAGLLVLAVVLQRRTPPAQSVESAPAASVTSRTQFQSPEHAPSTQPPPAPVLTAEPATRVQSLHRETVGPGLVPNKPARPSFAAGGRRPSATVPSSTTVVLPQPTASSPEAKPAQPAAKPVNADAIDPAELYRH